MPDTPAPPSTPSAPARTAATPSAAVTSTVQNGPLSDQEAIKLMELMVEEGPPLSQAAIDRVVEMRDRRFIAVFIELMRAAEIGMVSSAGYVPYISALQTLSGQSFERDWPAWVEWYGETDLSPPPGFTAWKGKLFSRIDPRFEDFLSDAAPARLRVEEIQWGGVVVDGIPALDHPRMIPGSQVDYLDPGEPVFGISLNGDSRAYPLRIMDWHEMANDRVGGVPVSLAYCTLCGAGIAYDGRASDGNTYTFGTSGLLFRSNKLMYDRQTQTLWNQMTGEPVLGELAGREVKLSLLPMVLTAWEDWLEQHPDTQVLDLNTGHNRLYKPGAAYADYFSSDETLFPVPKRSQLLPDKSRIYALFLEGVPKAYPLDTLAAEGVVNDQVGGTSVVLVTRRGSVVFEGQSLRGVLASGDPEGGRVTYDSGGEVRAYARGDEIFHSGPDPDHVLDSSGRPWEVTEEALLGPGGEQAPRLPGHLAYWFGWFAFFPNTLVYGLPN